jgi:hypothetical protein
VRGLPPPQTAAELSAQFDAEDQAAAFATECLKARRAPDADTDAAASADLSASNRAPDSLRGGRCGSLSTAQRKALPEVCPNAFVCRSFGQEWAVVSRICHATYGFHGPVYDVCVRLV